MAKTPDSSTPWGSLVLIAVVVGLVAAAFGWTAGWFSTRRLTPDRFLATFKAPGETGLGHRRNHAKGICFRGVFQANGAGGALSRAMVFKPGQYPVIGRFNLGDADPSASDATVAVRGLGIQITTPDGEQWRSAMINAPVFPVATPQAFYELRTLGQSKDPQAAVHFAAAHPEFVAFGRLAAAQVRTASYASERYNGLDAFYFVDEAGQRHAVRWLLLPAVPPVAASPGELAQLGPDFLFKDLKQRVAAGPLSFPMVVVVAAPADPTADPSRAWPEDRQHLEVGVLVVRQVEDEADGPCRDINYDPTVLPKGITVSDDPFPAARSAVYARSFALRTAEEKHYPRQTEAAP